MSRHTWIRALPFAFAALPFAVWLANAQSGGGSASSTGAPACIAVEQSAPYRGYGYNHLVLLRSSCTRDYTCQISTNAAPQPVRTVVAAGASAHVTTFVGSPAREFRVTVSCE